MSRSRPSYVEGLWSPGHRMSRKIGRLKRTAITQRQFKRADALRQELKSKGWQIEDTPKGPRLKPL